MNSRVVNIFIIIKSDFIHEFSKNIFQTYSELKSTVISVKNPKIMAYIRPVIKGCQSYDGILFSNEPGVSDVLTANPLKCNLNGSVLKVVVNEVWLILTVTFEFQLILIFSGNALL